MYYLIHIRSLKVKQFGNLFVSFVEEEHVVRLVVRHFASIMNMIPKSDNGAYSCRQLVQRMFRPCVVGTVVAWRYVRILTSAKSAAFAVVECTEAVACRLQCDAPKSGIMCQSVRVGIDRHELGLVVEHFFEMRYGPTLIGAIAMKSPAEVVVHPAFRHCR